MTSWIPRRTKGNQYTAQSTPRTESYFLVDSNTPSDPHLATHMDIQRSSSPAAIASNGGGGGASPLPQLPTGTPTQQQPVNLEPSAPPPPPPPASSTAASATAATATATAPQQDGTPVTTTEPDDPSSSSYISVTDSILQSSPPTTSSSPEQPPALPFKSKHDLQRSSATSSNEHRSSKPRTDRDSSRTEKRKGSHPNAPTHPIAPPQEFQRSLSHQEYSITSRDYAAAIEAERERVEQQAALVNSEKDELLREIAELKKSLSAREVDLVEWQKKDEDAKIKEEASKVREDNQFIEIKRLDTALNAAKDDLRNSRAFVDYIDSDDVNSIISEVKKINEWVDAIGIDILDEFEKLVPKGSLDSPLSQDHVKSFPTVFSQNDSKLSQFGELSAKKGTTLSEFVYDVFRSTIIKYLYICVFVPFKVGVDNPEEPFVGKPSTAIDQLYAHVKLSFPQDRSGRWRSITYESLPTLPDYNESTFITTISRTILSKVLRISLTLSSTTSTSTTFDHLLSKIIPKVTEAIKWRKKMQTLYLSWDYQVVRTLEYTEGLAAAGGGKGESTDLGCRAFGLARSRCVQVGKGVVEEKRELVLDPETILRSEFE